MNRPVPYSSEVWAEVARGRHPSVFVFVGPRADEITQLHRVLHGPGTALPVGQGVDPRLLTWPPLVRPTVVSCGASDSLVNATLAGLQASGAEDPRCAS